MAVERTDTISAQTDFTALVLPEEGSSPSIERLPAGDLPEGDVLIRVAYSSLNYKDGLALTGKGKVVRRYPMVPGIDLAGMVVESASPRWTAGDRVLVTGWGAGESHWGGYAQLSSAEADWPIALPEGLSLEQAMILGTAGLTAMLAVMALEAHGLGPEPQEVVVTGASGGVGSLAVMLLARRGHQVVASTGKADLRDYLCELGAAEIIGREVLGTPSERPLASGRWAGAVDTVGGDTLAGILRTLAPGAPVAACGNAGGNALNTTVLPFILRGVSLLGIDSNYCPRERRAEAWNHLAGEIPAGALQSIARTVPLEEVPALAPEIVEGRIRGRVVVQVPD